MQPLSSKKCISDNRAVISFNPKNDCFYDHLKNFLINVLQECDSKKIDIKGKSIDHVCYRVETQKRYLEMKSYLGSIGECLIESDVAGRAIATYKMSKPLIYKSFFVDVIELPAPKEGSSYREGFEHLELISKDPLIFKKKKIINSELKNQLTNFSIKWHYQSLESVINLEKNKKVFGALLKSNILEELSELDPVIAGTFPLGIHNDYSDLDIIVGGSDLDEMYSYVKKVCSPFSVKSIKEENYFTLNFSVDQIAFEIYGEEKASVHQRAFQHFQVEEKLLKVCSPLFRNSVQKARAKGLKTEPAFAEVLCLKNDPYEELLKFQEMSDRETYDYLQSIDKNYVSCDVVTYD